MMEVFVYRLWGVSLMSGQDRRARQRDKHEWSELWVYRKLLFWVCQQKIQNKEFIEWAQKRIINKEGLHSFHKTLAPLLSLLSAIIDSFVIQTFFFLDSNRMHANVWSKLIIQTEDQLGGESFWIEESLKYVCFQINH